MADDARTRRIAAWIDRLGITAFLLIGVGAWLSDMARHGVAFSGHDASVLAWVLAPFAAVLALAGAYALLVIHPFVFVVIAMIGLYLWVS